MGEAPREKLCRKRMIPRWYHRINRHGNTQGRNAARLRFSDAYMSMLTDSQARHIVSRLTERDRRNPIRVSCRADFRRGRETLSARIHRSHFRASCGRENEKRESTKQVRKQSDGGKICVVLPTGLTTSSEEYLMMNFLSGRFGGPRNLSCLHLGEISSARNRHVQNYLKQCQCMIVRENNGYISAGVFLLAHQALRRGTPTLVLRGDISLDSEGQALESVSSVDIRETGCTQDHYATVHVEDSTGASKFLTELWEQRVAELTEHPFRTRAAWFFDGAPIARHGVDPNLLGVVHETLTLPVLGGDNLATTSTGDTQSVAQEPQKSSGDVVEDCGHRQREDQVHSQQPSSGNTSVPMEVEEASTPPVSTSVTSEVCDAIVIDDSADDDDASDAVVHTVGPIRLTSHDMALLRPRQWLNDQIINGFVHLVNALCDTGSSAQGKSATPRAPCVRAGSASRRCYMFNTFLLVQYARGGYEAVRRWLKRVHLQDFQRLLFPINLGDQHWCLAFANVGAKTLRLYDSLSSPSAVSQSQLNPVKNFLLDALGIPTKTWMVDAQARCWQQQNGYDCGVHVCRTAYLLCTDNEACIDLSARTQAAYDAGKFRNKIRKALVAGTLVSKSRRLNSKQ
eukprot:m.514721 g.514721  ORF g.514721 m.514721 type:complete len:626 (+) comp21913_c0_seq4:431-2308(+)